MRIVVKHTQLVEVKNQPMPSLLRQVGDYMVSSVQRRINGGIGPDNAPLTVAVKRGSNTLRDRGQLLSSISSHVTGSQVAVGTNRQGAKTNHFGQTITAKGKWLWIPASSRTRTLQRRYGFKASQVMSGLKASGHSVWIQSKKGGSSGVVLAKKGKKGKVFVVFVLKKSVVIPARPFMVIDRSDRDTIRAFARRHLGVSR
jgi:phage gpG-like protein